ncbi:MAG: hypothetical protein RBS73_10120 [Prolixibacteraceae bacterium]|jgi:protein-tyrosine-phosphatase|nr:hypothetical protein [Prolixibacteraceae bacterium]
MPAVKILFLCSGDQLCRCLIARHILLLIDDKLDVYAAGIPPLCELSEERVEAMKKLGYETDTEKVKPFNELLDIEFDYLITLSHGVREQLRKYPRNYKLKLHMEFTDFCCGQTTEPEAIALFRKIRDEIENELGYFYYHILKQQA